MIVEELELENWKVFRDRHTFRFEEGLNLLVGPNEGGKSTLLRSLEYLLFVKHRSKAAEIEALRPWETTLGPRGAVVFRTDGEQYRLEKQYLSEARMVLARAHEGRFVRIGEGSEAETALASLLSTSPARGKGDREPLYRALCYLQNDDGIPDDWGEGVTRGMSAVVDRVVASPVELRIRKAIEKRFTETFTPGGSGGPEKARYKTQSELIALERQLRSVRDDLEAARTDIAKLEMVRRQIGDLERDAETASAAVGGTEKEIADLKPDLDQIPTWQSELTTLESGITTAAAEAKTVTEDLADHQTNAAKITPLQALVATGRADIATAGADSEAARRRVDALDARLQTEIDPALATMRTEVTRTRSLQEYRRVEAEVKRVIDDQACLSRLSGTISLVAAQLADKPEIANSTIAEAEQYQTDIGSIEAKLGASAPRIRFVPESPEYALFFEPEPLIDNGEYVLAAPTRIILPGVGTLIVGGIPGDIQALPGKLAEKRDALATILTKYSCDTVSELRMYAQERERLVQAKEAAEKERSRVLGTRNQEDLTSALESLNARLERMRTAVSEVTGDLAGLEPDALADRLETLEGELVSKETEKTALAADRERWAAKAAEHERRKGELETAVASAGGQITTLQERNTGIVTKYGTLNRLETLATQRTAELEMARTAYQGKAEEVLPRIAELQRKQQELEGQLRIQRERKAEIEQALEGKRGELRGLSRRDLEGTKEDLEAELENLERRSRTAIIQAEGVRLLIMTIKEAEEEQAASLGQPLLELVNRWLPKITGNAYSEIRVDPKTLEPGFIISPAYRGPIDPDHLSYGTREQVYVLFRLALGAVLGEKERQLVVLDDRLVNADPDRLERLCSVLEDASRQSCQILLATCNEAPYASLDANVVSIPGDGIGRA